MDFADTITLEHFRHLKRQAKTLVRMGAASNVREAQNAIARRRDYADWGELVRRVPVPLPREVRT